MRRLFLIFGIYLGPLMYGPARAIESPAGSVDADLDQLSPEKTNTKDYYKEETDFPKKSKKKSIAVKKNRIRPAEQKVDQRSQGQEPAAYVSEEESTKVNNESTGTWDSFETRLDDKDVARDVTMGIRVEDIVEPPSDYHYASFGRPDPFLPPAMTISEKKSLENIQAIEIPIVSPLQRSSIDQLKVAGVWQTDKQVWKAMVLTQDGLGIITKIGDPIGNRGGKITAIDLTGISAREFTLKADGVRDYRDLMLPLDHEHARPKDEPKTIKIDPQAVVPQ